MQALRKACTEHGTDSGRNPKRLRTETAHQYNGSSRHHHRGIGNGFPMAVLDVYRATTFGNHLACSAALAVLDVIEQEALVENAAQVGAYLMEELKKFPQIKEVRGRGLMIGLEFEEPVKELRLRLLKEQHVFTGVSGTKKDTTERRIPSCFGRFFIKIFTFARRQLFK